jgi:iron(III) transport system substrate-binding protein
MSIGRRSARAFACAASKVCHGGQWLTFAASWDTLWRDANKKVLRGRSDMPRSSLTRRGVLQGLAAAPMALPVLSRPAVAAAPPPGKVTPELIEAARKEGKVVWYTSVDLPVAERVAKAFNARYPGVPMRVERSGAERIFQRIGQEYGSKIHAVDCVNSSDAAHFIVWKRDGLLAPYVPEDVALHYPAEHKDPDGLFASWRSSLSVIGYNTRLVKPEEAPRSFADLLDPKWAGKIVKAHPGYSGTIMTATFQMARDLGWDYFEKLAQQKIMQVQSAADPPKKLALGERAIMADGVEYGMFQLKEKGEPVEIVYPSEGTPTIIGPSAVMKDAPNPNAARLATSFMFSLECQQLIVDFGGLRSFHAQVKEKPGRRPLKDIKLMKDDAAAVEKQADDIKARYTKYFKV